MNSDALLSLLFWQTIQVSLVACLALVITRLFAKDRPHFAHAMWALVLLKCLTPPLIPSPASPFSWLRAELGPSKAIEIEELTVPFDVAMTDIAPPLPPPGYELDLPQFNANHDVDEGGFSESIGPVPASEPFAPTKLMQPSGISIPWARCIFGIWGTGTVVVSFVAAFRFARFLRSIRRSMIETPASLAKQAAELSTRLKIRPVRVLVVDQPTGPAILGLLRPKIVMPKVVVRNSSAMALETMLAHEMVHCRRGDLWWSAIQISAVCLWWCHPLIWIASRLMSREAERSCDEETIATLGCSPAHYARSLLSVLEQKQQLRASPLLPGIRPVDLTAKRMERIMRLGQGCHRRCPVWVWGTFMVGAVTLLPGAALVLAQDETAEPKQKVPRVLRKLEKTLPMAPDLPNGRQPSDGAPSLESTNVERLLDRAMSELNLDRDEAEQLLLNRIGLNAPDKNMPEQIKFTVTVEEEEQCQVVLGGRKARAQICNGLLYVFESEKQRTRVRSIIDALRKDGFVQFSVEVEVFKVPRAFSESWSPRLPEVVHASHRAATTASLGEVTAEMEEALLQATKLPDKQVSRIAGPRLIINNGSAGQLQSGERLEVEIPSPDGYRQRKVEDGFRLEISVSSTDGPRSKAPSESSQADQYATVVLKIRQGWLELPTEIGKDSDDIAIPVSHSRFLECQTTLPVSVGAPASYVQLPLSKTDVSGMATLIMLRCRRLPGPAPEVTIRNGHEPDETLFHLPEALSEEQLRQAWVTVSGRLSDADYRQLIEEYANEGIEEYRRVDGAVQVIALQGDDTLQRLTWKRALEIYERIVDARGDSHDQSPQSSKDNHSEDDPEAIDASEQGHTTSRVDVDRALQASSDRGQEPQRFRDLTLEECIQLALQNADFVRLIHTPKAGQPAGTVRSDLGMEGTLHIPPSRASGGSEVEDALQEFDLQFSAVFGYESQANEEAGSSSGQLFPRVASNQQMLRRERGAEANVMPVVIGSATPDISLLQFEAKVRNLVKRVENAYWDLSTSYRSYEASKDARENALKLWRKTQTPFSHFDLPSESEAQARALVHQFESGRLAALHGSRVPGMDPFGLYGREELLRETLGFAKDDGTLLRPVSQPTNVRVVYDWDDILIEALRRNLELRRLKWVIEQRELELIGAKNRILPQLDTSLTASWVGVGDHLASADRRRIRFPNPGSTALDELTGADYQEYGTRLEYTPNAIGARRAQANVLNARLQLTKLEEELMEKELFLTHELDRTYKTLESCYGCIQDYSRQLIATSDEIRVHRERIDRDPGELAPLLDVLLRAEERRSRAKLLYYQSIGEYNKSMVELHYLKGSLLDYNGIQLVEDQEDEPESSSK